MMKYLKCVIALLVILAVVAGVAGCKEGPLERAGKKVDKTVEDIKN
jgi:predicted small lipoprotein YifL